MKYINYLYIYNVMDAKRLYTCTSNIQIVMKSKISMYIKPKMRGLQIRIDEDTYEKLRIMGYNNRVTPNKVAAIGVAEFVDAVSEMENEEIHQLE